MIHKQRSHNIGNVATLEELAEMLIKNTYGCNAGFRCGKLTLLNDSYSEDSIQDYEVQVDGKRIDSLTVQGWSEDGLLGELKSIAARFAEGGKLCPRCGSRTSHCAECGEVFPMGTSSKCPRLACAKMNAPIDCDGCALVVSDKLDGVLDLEQNLVPWRTA